MDKQTALEKIKKCLSLSKSSNPNESALALKQMKKMMDQYNVSMTDVHESVVNEAIEEVRKKRHPSWKLLLASIVAKAFDCKIVTMKAGGIKFIGLNSNSEIALYAFETLLRQLDRDRKKYMANNHKNFDTRSRNIFSNTYCSAWLDKIHNVVKNIVPKEEDEKIIKNYMNKKFTLKTKKIQPKISIGEQGQKAHAQGLEDGSKANLFHGTGGGNQAMIG